MKALKVTDWVYMVFDGIFVNTWNIKGWFTFLGGFHHIFCHEFFILKSKLRDLNSRLGGYGIRTSEIYFLNLMEKIKEKD